MAPVRRSLIVLLRLIAALSLTLLAIGSGMTSAATAKALAEVPAFTPLAALAAPPAVVVKGTGDPDIDVPAVQAAVDQGGDVILKGHFSFDRLPTIIPALDGFPLATILVSKAIAISGMQDEDGEMTSIEGGTTPFYVNAPRARVTIQGLRFVRPKGSALLVNAVSGLVIASCKIEGVEPVNHGSAGIDIRTIANIPNPARPGQPDRVSGTLLIVNNDIDVAGGTALDNTLGVFIFSVGVPGAEVEAHVSGNNIKNTTQPAVNVRRVGGRVYVERNVITTGSVAGPAAGPQVIRVVNIGSYLIAHNSVHSRWAQAEGIGVFSQFAEWPIERAIVVDNDVNMEAPEDTIFGDASAGIAIRGFARGNVVLDNRIRGRARAALSVAVFRGGVPANNAFVRNRFDDFEGSLADVFVGEHVMNTLIVGPGKVEDHGVGTIIVRSEDIQ